MRRQDGCNCRYCSATKSKDLNVWPASLQDCPDLGKLAGRASASRCSSFTDRHAATLPICARCQGTYPLRGQCSSLQANEQHGVRLAAPNKIAQIAGHLPGVGRLCGLLLPEDMLGPVIEGTDGTTVAGPEARRRFPGGLTGNALLHRDHRRGLFRADLVWCRLLADSGCPSGRLLPASSCRQLCSSSQPQRRSIRLLITFTGAM